MSERLLTPKEAARILGVHPLTLYRWAKKGKIKYVETPSGRMRYPMSEIQRLLKLREKKQIERLYRVALYVRHIDEKRALEILERLEKYSKNKEYIIVDRIIDTSGEICGKTEGMKKLLNLVKSRKIGKIIIPNKLAFSYFCFWVFEELFAAYDVVVEIAFPKEDKDSGYIEMLDWLIAFIQEKRERYPL